MRIMHFILIALFTMTWGSLAQSPEKVEFTYWRCVSEEIADKDADLILVIEVIDIQRIRDPIRSHFDFGVVAKVVERRKGDYNKSIMGIHVPRRIPLEPYDPKKYSFEKGKQFVIKAKVDKEGTVTIHDSRVRRTLVLNPR
jgi:hypothetical protein